MNCEKIISKIDKLISKKVKKRNLKKIDDFEEIRRCKDYFNDELEKDTSSINRKKETLELVSDYISKRKINCYPRVYTNFLFIFFSIYIIIFNILLQNDVYFIELSLLNITVLITVIIGWFFIVFGNGNLYKARKNFIISQALNLLIRELDDEEKNKLLQPCIDVKLNKEELSELLDESKDIMDIKFYNDYNKKIDKIDQDEILYDRKLSLQRRKRNRK